MTNQSGSNPRGLQSKIQNALNGAQQELPSGSSLQINGQAVTQAQLVTQLAGYLPAMTAVTNAKAVLEQALQARAKAQPDVREFLAQLRAALVAFYGRGSPSLGKFGMSAPKPPTSQNPQTAILAAAKRTLTRQKRGTMGKNQKASIKALGTPQVSIGASGVSITPAATEQPAVTPAASPAPVTPDPAGSK